MSGEMQWHRWWRYWSDDEDTNDEEDYEEEYREPPVTKKLRCLKERHEQALNAENIADQEVQNEISKNAKLGSAGNLSSSSAAEKKKEAAKIAATKAEDQVLEFAKSHNIEPYSENEKLLKEMRRKTSALDGSWNLHSVTMKNCRGMTKEEVEHVMKMKEYGALYLNFQFSIGPGGRAKEGFGSEDGFWCFQFEVKRSEKCLVPVKRGRSKRQKTVMNADVLKLDLWWSDVGEPWGLHAPGFEIFVINSDNEIIENAKRYGMWDINFRIDLDRLKLAGQEISDVSYRVAINVFPQDNEDDFEDDLEDEDY